jgi:hypothetical protein
MTRNIADLKDVTPDRLAERADVFAAYYLPGVDHREVYDSITPVNLFRLVFRNYFQAHLERLPDETYWSTDARPFKFTRVTDEVTRYSGVDETLHRQVDLAEQKRPDSRFGSLSCSSFTKSGAQADAPNSSLSAQADSTFRK